MRLFEDHPSTKEGRAREGNVKTITPNYKLGSEKPSHDLKLGSSGYLPNEKGDYKVSMRHEDYKLTVIDPKVRSSANMPLRSQTLPEAKKQMADDFPSQHSKRSLIKLEPLEQRRFKSVESRPITTSNYLTESVERHREMEASRLRDYLKAKESDANKPWNKPGWPGPKSIETLQKKVTRTQSMLELHRPVTPLEFSRLNEGSQQRSPSSQDPGWLIKLRTSRYLDATSTSSLKKHRSMDHIGGIGNKTRPHEAERRASWSHNSETSAHSKNTQRPRFEPPPVPESQPKLTGENLPTVQKKTSRTQIVYENEPIPPSLVAVNVSWHPEETRRRPSASTAQSYHSDNIHQFTQQEHQFVEESKQLSTRHPFHREQMRPESTTFQNLSEEERYKIMHDNLRKHRQSRNTTQKLPAVSFNGPFFKLEEISPKSGSQSAAPQFALNGTTDNFGYLSDNETHHANGRDMYGRELNKMRIMTSSEIELNEHNQMQAIQNQQQRLYEQQHGVTSPVPIIDYISPNITQYPQYVQTTIPPKSTQEPHYPHDLADPGMQPQNIRVFETRPISAMSDITELKDSMRSPEGTSWKRTYIVEKPEEVDHLPMAAIDRSQFSAENDKHQVLHIIINNFAINHNINLWVVKRRAASAQCLLDPSANQEFEDVEVIHQRNYHRLQGGYHESPRASSESRRTSHSSQYDKKVNDWEKIYELPPHSSTIVGKDVPRNIDVRKRLSQFQGSIENLKNISGRQSVVRANSVESSASHPYPLPDYEQDFPQPQSRRSLNRHTNNRTRQQQIPRRNSVASTPIGSPAQYRYHHSQPRHSYSRQSRSRSRAPSSIPLSPGLRSETPNAMRVRTRIANATAPSPTPPSYERARPYVPPPLPSGYRLGDPVFDQRVTSPSPGHTKKMMRMVFQAANQPPKNEDLDFLARKNEELLERSRERRAGYKLIDSEIVKEGPEPVPQAFKDQVRDMLESRNSVDTTTTKDHDRSGYVTVLLPVRAFASVDVSTATWQFSTHSFSPRSVVSVNGARDDILKVFGLLYILEIPSVTETVQRFEETRRTEEIMRRVQRKERRERRSRHHSSSHHHNGREAWENGYQSERRVASVPPKIVYEKSKRAMTDDEISKVVKEAYEAADEARRNHRDVFGDGYDRRSTSSYRRGSQQGSPLVEFPPTLPRRYIFLTQPYFFSHDDDMSRLEAEFRDSLLMPLPRPGNIIPIHSGKRNMRLMLILMVTTLSIYPTSSKHGVDVDINNNTTSDPPVVCNKSQLRKLMEECLSGNLDNYSPLLKLAHLDNCISQNMTGTAKEAKMAIIDAAERDMGGRFTVICANGQFSYLTTTNTYCLHTQNNLTCYAFRTDLS
uniref:Ground-like domain-containing protein n=1 Tax=Heterorhabditis bacteriophora TaxID=37862 RepID=A0A1I7XSJ2_HETBA